MTHQTIGIIPARAGSKGLPGKNVRPLRGKPLYRHAVDAGLEAGLDRVYLSTDIDEILDATDLPENVQACLRPSELATSTATMDQALLNFFASHFKDDATAVLLQPTSPLRQAKHIAQALEVYQSGDYDLVMSVCPTPSSILKYGMMEGSTFKPVNDPAYCFANRQQLPQVYRPNGAVYVFDVDWFRRNKGFVTERIGVIEMTEQDSHDIDTLEDFLLCEQILKEARP